MKNIYRNVFLLTALAAASLMFPGCGKNPTGSPDGTPTEESNFVAGKGWKLLKTVKYSGMIGVDGKGVIVFHDLDYNAGKLQVFYSMGSQSQQDFFIRDSWLDTYDSNGGLVSRDTAGLQDVCRYALFPVDWRDTCSQLLVRNNAAAGLILEAGGTQAGIYHWKLIEDGAVVFTGEDENGSAVGYEARLNGYDLCTWSELSFPSTGSGYYEVSWRYNNTWFAGRRIIYKFNTAGDILELLGFDVIGGVPYVFTAGNYSNGDSSVISVLTYDSTLTSLHESYRWKPVMQQRFNTKGFSCNVTPGLFSNGSNPVLVIGSTRTSRKGFYIYQVDMNAKTITQKAEIGMTGVIGPSLTYMSGEVYMAYSDADGNITVAQLSGSSPTIIGQPGFIKENPSDIKLLARNNKLHLVSYGASAMGKFYVCTPE